jgi:hypothetical protein
MYNFVSGGVNKTQTENVVQVDNSGFFKINVLICTSKKHALIEADVNNNVIKQ